MNKSPATQNQFEVLNVEDSSQSSGTLQEENSGAVIQSSENPVTNTLDKQLDDYRINQKHKFDTTCRKTKISNLKESNAKTVNPVNAENTVLVIGDSMVKHIDAKRLIKQYIVKRSHTLTVERLYTSSLRNLMMELKSSNTIL